MRQLAPVHTKPLHRQRVNRKPLMRTQSLHGRLGRAWLSLARGLLSAGSWCLGWPQSHGWLLAGRWGWQGCMFLLIQRVSPAGQLSQPRGCSESRNTENLLRLWNPACCWPKSPGKPRSKSSKPPPLDGKSCKKAGQSFSLPCRR